MHAIRDIVASDQRYAKTPLRWLRSKSEQLAELLNTIEQIVRAYARDGSVPAHRKPGGRKFNFLCHEIFQWLLDNRYDPESEIGEYLQPSIRPSDPLLRVLQKGGGNSLDSTDHQPPEMIPTVRTHRELSEFRYTIQERPPRRSQSALCVRIKALRRWWQCTGHSLRHIARRLSQNDR